jgi:hypothetical protein
MSCHPWSQANDSLPDLNGIVCSRMESYVVAWNFLVLVFEMYKYGPRLPINIILPFNLTSVQVQPPQFFSLWLAYLVYEHICLTEPTSGTLNIGYLVI